MIKIQEVTKKYGDQIVLNKIDLTIPNVGLVVLKGANGSGKTSLLNLIAGLDKPNEGTIEVDGKVITNFSEKEMTDYREKFITLIPQKGELFDNLTVKENIELLGGNQKIDDICNFLKLQEIQNEKAKNISGGEQQKTAIGRAIMKSTSIIIADEPTSSLDPETSIIIFKFLKRLSQNKLIILVTHDIESVSSFADVVIELQDGKAYESKKTENVVETHNSKVFKNNFKFIPFTFKNFFTNKKKLSRNMILFIFAFLLILFTNTLSNINFIEVHKNTMIDEKENHMLLYKNASDKLYSSTVPFTETDLEKIKRDFSTEKFFSLKKIYFKSKPIELETQIYPNLSSDEVEKNPYYTTYYYQLSFVSVDNMQGQIIGRKPNAQNEVIISSYLADLMMKNGVKTRNGYVTPKDYEAILNLEIIIEDHHIKIVGIKLEEFSKYETLKSIYDKELYSLLQFDTTIFGRNIYVLNSFFDYMNDIPQTLSSDYNLAINEIDNFWTNCTFTLPVKLIDNTTIENLLPNEVILNANAIEALGFNKLDSIGKTVNITITNSQSGEKTVLENMTIKGVSMNDYNYFNEITLKDFVSERQNTPNLVLQITDKERISSLLKTYDEYSEFTVKTKYSNYFKDLEERCGIIKKIMFIFAIILSAVGIMIFINYIITDVENHKRDIAVLKALGIKNSKILQVILTESLTISTAAYILSFLIFILIKPFINTVLIGDIPFKVNILPTSIFLLMITWIVSVLISVLVSAIINSKFQNISPLEMLKKNH